MNQNGTAARYATSTSEDPHVTRTRTHTHTHTHTHTYTRTVVVCRCTTYRFNSSTNDNWYWTQRNMEACAGSKRFCKDSIESPLQRSIYHTVSRCSNEYPTTTTTTTTTRIRIRTSRPDPIVPDNTNQPFWRTIV
jgi:hypothetical protein